MRLRSLVPLLLALLDDTSARAFSTRSTSLLSSTLQRALDDLTPDAVVTAKRPCASSDKESGVRPRHTVGRSSCVRSSLMHSTISNRGAVGVAEGDAAAAAAAAAEVAGGLDKDDGGKDGELATVVVGVRKGSAPTARSLCPDALVGATAGDPNDSGGGVCGGGSPADEPMPSLSPTKATAAVAVSATTVLTVSVGPMGTSLLGDLTLLFLLTPGGEAGGEVAALGLTAAAITAVSV